MEWIWFITTVGFLFLFFVIYRIAYIKGYRAGGKMVLSQWKDHLKEGVLNDDEHI